MEGLASLTAAPSRKTTSLSSSFLASSSGPSDRPRQPSRPRWQLVLPGFLPLALPCQRALLLGCSEAIGSSLRSLLPAQNGKASSTGLSTKDIMDIESKVLVPHVREDPHRHRQGQGSTLVGHGREGDHRHGVRGFAVNALGHSDPDWLRAVTQQAAELAHRQQPVLHMAPWWNLAKRLVDYSFADRVFFANSGEGMRATSHKLQFTNHRTGWSKEGRERAPRASAQRSDSHFSEVNWRGSLYAKERNLRYTRQKGCWDWTGIEQGNLLHVQARKRTRLPSSSRGSTSSLRARGRVPTPPSSCPSATASTAGPCGALALTYKEGYRTPFEPGHAGGRDVRRVWEP